MTISEHDKILKEAKRLRDSIKALQTKNEKLINFAYISIAAYAFILLVIYLQG